MDVLILYATTHNCTKKIANNIVSLLPNINITTHNVKNIHNFKLNFQSFFCVLFCVPTYGCEDLHEDMEHFLINCDSIQNLKFTIIETGNYYGYDDFTFGAKKILLKYLTQNKCTLFCQCLSLDTFPRVNHAQLKQWVNYFKSCLTNQ